MTNYYYLTNRLFPWLALARLLSPSVVGGEQKRARELREEGGEYF